MPLLKGTKARSKKGISANISRSVREGKPQKQAIAIAFSVAGKGRKKASKKKSSKKIRKKLTQKQAILKRG